MAGSSLRAVQESFSVKVYRWKEDRFVFFMKKKTVRPWIPSFPRKKNQTKVVSKTEDDVP